MEQVLATFGIDWKLLLINAANFGLLLFVLWYFLYTPLLRMLKERQQRIERGVQNAEQAERRLEEIEGTRAATLARAGQEADELLARARDAAREKEEELIEQGEHTAETMVNEAKAQAEELKAQALRESKQEVAKLIVLGMEKAFKQSK